MSQTPVTTTDLPSVITVANTTDTSKNEVTKSARSSKIFRRPRKLNVYVL